MRIVDKEKIAKLVNLFEKKYKLDNELSLVLDRILGLIKCMDSNDIERARKIFTSKVIDL